MNLLLLKQISILSAIVGAIIGFITFLPLVGLLCFIVLLTCISAFILVYMKRNDLIGIINVKEGCLFGAIIGFVSFIAYSIIFTPISMVLGLFIESYTTGFMRFFLNGGLGTFVVMIFLIIFMAGISALFNGFTGLITAYIYQLITGESKDSNQNISVDFEIK